MARRAKTQPDRVQALKFHLTYAALYPGELSHASFKLQIHAWAAERECELREWQSAREDHDEPADPERSEHFHVFVHFSQRIHIKNRRTTQLFDLDGRDGRRLHPEVQAVGVTVKDRQRVLAYGRKYGDYEAELEEELSASEEEEREASWGERLNAATTVRDGMQMLVDEFPDVYYSLGARVQPMLAARLGDTSSRSFHLRDFNRAPLEFDDMMPVVLHGLSNAGKTEFAVAHFKQPVIVRRRDDLKSLGLRVDGIIFDDVDLKDWKPEEVIALLNVTKDRTVGARYSDARLPANVPLIFTTNLGMTSPFDSLFPMGKSAEQQVAIARRFKCVPVSAPLFDRVCV